MSMPPHPPHVEKNLRTWNRDSARYQSEHASQLGTVEPTWGVWARPEREVGALPEVAGKDVLELGCGGAQWSIALARRGARVTGLDVSAAQLEHARALVARAGVAVRLVEASAEATGLPDASFDLVFCDHGAMSFADPLATVPEAARLLRPGGWFVFNMATPWLDACWDPATDRVTDRLHADYFAMHAFATADAVTFQLPYGRWVKLLRRHGLAIEDLIELPPPAGAETTYRDFAPLEWARRWPAEHIATHPALRAGAQWKLRKEAP